MINIKNRTDCCGCTACALVCSHDAIMMKYDAEGFAYPLVNIDKCINCGLCEKACPQHLSIRKDLQQILKDYDKINKE